MDRRSATQTVGVNLRTAIDAAGVRIATVAQATDMPEHDLVQRLEGGAEISVVDALRVGGFLCLSASDIFKQVAA